MAATDGDIKIPMVGEVPKKKALLFGGIGVAGVGAFILWRRHQAGSAASAPADTNSTGDPNAIDPATGLPYSDEGGSDEAAYPGTAGGIEYGTGGQIPYGSGYGTPYGAYGGGGYYGGGVGTTTTPTNNQTWLDDAESALGSTAAVQAALTKVLGGVTVTTAQKDIFLEAVGILGAPPEGYPPIHTTDTSGHPKPGTKKVKVPKVTGDAYETAAAKIKAVGLVARRGSANVGVVSSQSPEGGTEVAKGSSVVLRGAGGPVDKKPHK